ncbi:uncharacterized protein LOC115448403 [Manduca sexta]|uniref:uncharacterized protein LOC115448403 n=1 Tax=Manduca sexta TaxID=7130 RepID=UPI00188E73A9|nr:uncharacterized protein LOC115448403 [Manduca sexta]
MEPRSKVKKRGASREMFYDLFQVYDPSFLAAVWPKITNGVHLMLDVSCWKDMSLFFKDLSEGKSWAYSAVDASGHYQSGLFSGNRFWLGSQEQCDRLDGEFVNIRGNYTGESLQAVDYATEMRRSDRFRDYGSHDWRWVLNRNELKQRDLRDDRPPIRLAYTIVELVMNISKFTIPKTYNIIMGMCIPRSCSKYDVESVVNFSIMINENLKTNRTLPRTTRISTVRQIKPYDIKGDFGAICFIGVTATLILLGIIATAVELGLVKCSLYNRNAMSFDLEKYNRNNEVKGNKIVNELNSKVDKATNVNTIKLANAKIAIDNINTPKNNIVCASQENCQRCGKYKQQCSSARRTVHSPSPAKDSSSSKIEYRRNGVCCRMLFCFSFVYSWRRIFNKNTANKDLALTHGLKIVATFCVMFVHVCLMVNYISASARDVNGQNVYYILTMGTVAFDTLFFISGLISSHHFFYLKSRYTVEELVSFGGRCGQILQFVCFVTNRIIRMLPSYAYAILLSAVLTRVQRDTAVLTLPDGDDQNCNSYWWRNLIYISNMYPEDQQCMQVSWFVSTETQLHAAGALAFSNVFEAYSSIIDRPLARVAPYFIGMFTGWLIHSVRSPVKISKISLSALWVVSISLVLLPCSLPLMGAGRWVSALLHAGWPLGLLFPILLCSTTYAELFRRVLSSSTACALSRLCLGALLLHGAAARLVLLGAGTAACSSPLCLWIYYTATSVLTLLAALLLSLLVEMPCCSLLRRLSDCATR